MIYEYFLLTVIVFLNAIIEFLPISSTAHNIILFKFLKIEFIDINLILAFSQLGIILTICIYFLKDILNIIRNFFFDGKIRFFCFKIVMTTLPSVLFGFLFHKIIKNIFYKNTLLIFLFLFIGGVLMLFVKEKKTSKEKNIYDIDLKTSLKIGLFQSLSLIPGISRSASTIYSAMFFKINKALSIRYSFFLSIYVSFFACLFDIYKNFYKINNDNISVLIFSFTLSFLFSLLLIKKMFTFLENTKVKYFAYYRIIIAILLTTLFLV